MVAAPIAYTVRGEEYIAILVGRGGVFPLATGEIALKSGESRNVSRMLAFKIGGKAVLPPPSKASAATIGKGEMLFQRYCSPCHGDMAVSGGLLPDLRYSNALSSDQWFKVVLDGLLQSNGMVSFRNELSREDAAAIRAYVIARANQAMGEKAGVPAPAPASAGSAKQ